ncbi:MAG: hypothetical protein AAFR52_10745 [Pseudomonadota bacterium]
MTATLLSFARRTPGWSNEEQALLTRVERLIAGAGIAVETEMGETDEGDPWCVFCLAETGDVVVHLARIDGRYSLVSRFIAEPLEGVSLSHCAERFLDEAVALAPAPRNAQGAGAGGFYIHPSAMLAGVMMTIMLYAVLQEGGQAQASVLGQDSAGAEADTLLDAAALAAILEGDTLDLEAAVAAAVEAAEIEIEGAETPAEAAEIAAKLRQITQSVTSFLQEAMRAERNAADAGQQGQNWVLLQSAAMIAALAIVQDEGLRKALGGLGEGALDSVAGPAGLALLDAGRGALEAETPMAEARAETGSEDRALSVATAETHDFLGLGAGFWSGLQAALAGKNGLDLDGQTSLGGPGDLTGSALSGGSWSGLLSWSWSGAWSGAWASLGASLGASVSAFGLGASAGLGPSGMIAENGAVGGTGTIQSLDPAPESGDPAPRQTQSDPREETAAARPAESTAVTRGQAQDGQGAAQSGGPAFAIQDLMTELAGLARFDGVLSMMQEQVAELAGTITGTLDIVVSGTDLTVPQTNPAQTNPAQTNPELANPGQAVTLVGGQTGDSAVAAGPTLSPASGLAPIDRQPTLEISDLGADPGPAPVAPRGPITTADTQGDTLGDTRADTLGDTLVFAPYTDLRGAPEAAARGLALVEHTGQLLATADFGPIDGEIVARHYTLDREPFFDLLRATDNSSHSRLIEGNVVLVDARLEDGFTQAPRSAPDVLDPLVSVSLTYLDNSSAVLILAESDLDAWLS